ncbi:MAG: circadian clock KaiB family protein [Pegethrix bostrychoides GSE-TBD4-15B]|uniref:Circadian clock KaiB family protein n=1 Tax=Pegethrix bostrychoides GSE-TBD4-15B TaxID=2839662 RepID=A0A951PFK6_9CYAN|nr:circadian clock KaiB family protein [Pegethrix bostrychoides GSE-TBD4-15B]
MPSSQLNSPRFQADSRLFKGIALFTPGGDLVYCIDPQKQTHWHLQLCLFLQELLGLAEPPHFLVPCFTATVDHWLDPRSQTLTSFAEIYPYVSRHQTLLNALFGSTDLNWQPAHRHSCDPLVIAAHRQQFPQLWQTHDLVARLQPAQPAVLPAPPQSHDMAEQGYVMRLFVSGSNSATERILTSLHHLLEHHLPQPYTLKVVDVRKHPELAEANQITATPTLIKLWPEPIRRIVGEIDDPVKLLQVIC